MMGFNWYMNSTLNAAGLEPGVLPTSKAMEYLLGQLRALEEQGITMYVYALPTTLRGHAIRPGANASIANANAAWDLIPENMQSLPRTLSLRRPVAPPPAATELRHLAVCP